MRTIRSIPLFAISLSLAAACSTPLPPQGEDLSKPPPGPDLSLPGNDLATGGADLAMSGADLAAAADLGATLDAACTTYAQQYCARYGTCSFLGNEIIYGDDNTCRGRVQLSCMARGMAPGTGFGPSQITACAAAIATASCGDFFNMASAGAIAACNPVAGTLADGAACGDHSQCHSAFCTAPAGGC